MATTPAEDIKVAIDAQSGRFEFLKQSLTLGLAGIAGTAALFTDTSKLPSTLWSVITIGAFGVALILVVGGALFALSAYANLLQHYATETDRITNTNTVIKWARVAFCGLIVAAAAMIAFAVGQVWSARAVHKISGTAAIEAAWKNMSNQGCPVQLEQLVGKEQGYTVRYRSELCSRQFVLTIEPDGNVSAVQSVPLPAPLPKVTPPTNVVRKRPLCTRDHRRTTHRQSRRSALHKIAT